ncbi:hypothetical protein AK812_SmicGene41667 [Symbiodinium microadriaticum]|uniref:Uncharacterized protein n=1 Tax=Symbiodinium microadriaticum TaxID=2951 RepID=A0A1Q9C5J0_SYMMI|nr:hypothetical protein AK812_SmicGene41667 [Symbiodinium microadriaticum]
MEPSALRIAQDSIASTLPGIGFSTVFFIAVLLCRSVPTRHGRDVDWIAGLVLQALEFSASHVTYTKFVHEVCSLVLWQSRGP